MQQGQKYFFPYNREEEEVFVLYIQALHFLYFNPKDKKDYSTRRNIENALFYTKEKNIYHDDIDIEYDNNNAIVATNNTINVNWNLG